MGGAVEKMKHKKKIKLPITLYIMLVTTRQMDKSIGEPFTCRDTAEKACEEKIKEPNVHDAYIVIRELEQ